ncbi:MAG TPA: type II toxin-antitoxin system VapC family toxin [Roseiarcus sp.]
MIVDTSAIIAVLKEETDAPRFLRALTISTEPKRISAANYLEAGVVVDANRNPVLSRRLDDLVVQTEIEVEPVTREQAEIARAAYRDFGKGSGHPAELNFGDCFAYALAKSMGEPLLFKGDDFSRTDVAIA